MIVKIIRKGQCIIQECSRIEMKDPVNTVVEHPNGNAENYPEGFECLLDIYVLREGLQNLAFVSSEPIFKGTVVYLENNDGRTIEQYHW